MLGLYHKLRTQCLRLLLDSEGLSYRLLILLIALGK